MTSVSVMGEGAMGGCVCVCVWGGGVAMVTQANY